VRPPLAIATRLREETPADAEPWLMRAEDRNNQVIAVSRLLLTNDHPFRDPLYFASVKDGAAILGCALAATPDGLELTDLPAGAAQLLVPSVAEMRPTLPWVGGPSLPAREFARAWAGPGGRGWQVRHDFVVFRLNEVVAPRPVPGALRLADAHDWPLLRSWAPGYARDTGSPFDVTAFFERRLRRRELHVWDHGGPKSMVAATRNTPNGIVITAVYTPDEQRGRGYASNGVAAVSAHALVTGAAFCVLLSEPEPARIYRALGYQPSQKEIEEVAIFRIDAKAVKEYARIGYPIPFNQPAAASVKSEPTVDVGDGRPFGHCLNDYRVHMEAELT